MPDRILFSEGLLRYEKQKTVNGFLKEGEENCLTLLHDVIQAEGNIDLINIEQSIHEVTNRSYYYLGLAWSELHRRVVSSKARNERDKKAELRKQALRKMVEDENLFMVNKQAVDKARKVTNLTDERNRQVLKEILKEMGRHPQEETE